MNERMQEDEMVPKCSPCVWLYIRYEVTESGGKVTIPKEPTASLSAAQTFVLKLSSPAKTKQSEILSSGARGKFHTHVLT